MEIESINQRNNLINIRLSTQLIANIIYLQNTLKDHIFVHQMLRNSLKDEFGDDSTILKRLTTLDAQIRDIGKEQNIIFNELRMSMDQILEKMQRKKTDASAATETFVNKRQLILAVKQQIFAATNCRNSHAKLKEIPITVKRYMKRADLLSTYLGITIPSIGCIDLTDAEDDDVKNDKNQEKQHHCDKEIGLTPSVQSISICCIDLTAAEDDDIKIDTNHNQKQQMKQCDPKVDLPQKKNVRSSIEIDSTKNNEQSNLTEIHQKPLSEIIGAITPNLSINEITTVGCKDLNVTTAKDDTQKDENQQQQQQQCDKEVDLPQDNQISDESECAINPNLSSIDEITTTVKNSSFSSSKSTWSSKSENIFTFEESELEPVPLYKFEKDSFHEQWATISDIADRVHIKKSKLIKAFKKKHLLRVMTVESFKKTAINLCICHGFLKERTEKSLLATNNNGKQKNADVGKKRTNKFIRLVRYNDIVKKMLNVETMEI